MRISLANLATTAPIPRIWPPAGVPLRIGVPKRLPPIEAQQMTWPSKHSAFYLPDPLQTS